MARPIRTEDEAGPVSHIPLRLQILGPLRLWRDGVELDPGPRQQAYLLALLLARAGRPLSAGELIDLIWDGDAPATAINVVHKYIGALRRIFEPTLPSREAGSYLQRHGNGYQLITTPGMIDLISFREHVETARTHLNRLDTETALDHYAEALALWHGPAGHGLSHGSAAIPIFTALDSEFFDACAVVTDLAVSLGRPERALPHLQLAASMAPLHESVQASLITTLAAAGQQAEALSVFRAMRARLAESLGIEPGHALQAAHQRVLSQSLPPAVTPAVVERPSPAPVPAFSPGDRVGLVGRAEELAVLRRAVDPVLAGETGLVIVQGEPGVGKTRLLEEAAAEADRRGALVVWGHCLDGNGTPSMWPWVQVIGTILNGLPAAVREKWLNGELGRLVDPRDNGSATPALPDNGTQFRLFERVVAVIGQVSAQQPVLLVIDDLQWADAASLHLFAHLTGRLPCGTVVVGALRDRAPAPGSELSRMLATASRVSGHRRVRLGPLGEADVAELVRRETGKDPSSGRTRDIHARTAGNPFFVRELSRLLTNDSGVLTEDTARAGVPSTVHDVVRDRIADLDEESQHILQVAAFLGRDVDLTLLAHAAGLDIATCLDRLHPFDALGLLGPTPDDPFSFRFAHDLVRESVVETTPPPRATRLHLHIADALEHKGSDDESVAERLAYHLWAAGPLADPARTAQALMRAGRRAAMKSAFEAARPQLESAVQVARTAGLAELELSALSLLTTVVRRRAGYGGSTVELLKRAEHLARTLGREAEAADFLFSRVVGAAHSLSAECGVLARRLFDQGMASTDPILRVYGLEAWGLHQWSVGNIGVAYRCLSGDNRTMLDNVVPRREENPLRSDLQQLWPVWQTVLTALYGDLDAARALLDTVEADAGDDPYAVAIWAHYASMVASMAGDAVWGLHAVRRWIAANPAHFFIQVDYLRLSWCWARALTGDDPVGAVAEAEQAMVVTMLDPPRWGIPFHYGLIAEMALAAGMPDKAAAALDRADHFLDVYNQRYAEGLLLLLRARLFQARGQPTTTVHALAEKARTLSTEREAHLFARRAEKFLAELEADRADS